MLPLSISKPVFIPDIMRALQSRSVHCWGHVALIGAIRVQGRDHVGEPVDGKIILKRARRNKL